MATWKEVEKAIKEGKGARRPYWQQCKIIRGWLGGDADYFMTPIADTIDIIMQQCDIPCDCKIGIWQKNQEDVKAEDWEIVEIK